MEAKVTEFQSYALVFFEKVIFFGDNIPKERATQAMEVATQSDAFLVLGSSLMTVSAYRHVRAAHEAGAMTAIVNIGETRADDLVPLKINARVDIAEFLMWVHSVSQVSKTMSGSIK